MDATIDNAHLYTSAQTYRALGTADGQARRRLTTLAAVELEWEPQGVPLLAQALV